MLHSRRSFFKAGVAAGVLTSGVARRLDILAQVRTPSRARTIQTPVLNIGFEESGDIQGFPISDWIVSALFHETAGMVSAAIPQGDSNQMRTRPCRIAMARASARLRAPSFARTEATWNLAV